MFTTTSRYVKQLDVSTLQSRIRTIVILINFNKISPMITAYYECCFYLFSLFLVPNFQVVYLDFLLFCLNCS